GDRLGPAFQVGQHLRRPQQLAHTAPVEYDTNPTSHQPSTLRRLTTIPGCQPVYGLRQSATSPTTSHTSPRTSMRSDGTMSVPSVAGTRPPTMTPWRSGAASPSGERASSP